MRELGERGRKGDLGHRRPSLTAGAAPSSARAQTLRNAGGLSPDGHGPCHGLLRARDRDRGHGGHHGPSGGRPGHGARGAGYRDGEVAPAQNTQAGCRRCSAHSACPSSWRDPGAHTGRWGHAAPPRPGAA